MGRQRMSRVAFLGWKVTIPATMGEAQTGSREGSAGAGLSGTGRIQGGTLGNLSAPSLGHWEMTLARPLITKKNLPTRWHEPNNYHVLPWGEELPRSR